MGKSRMWLLAVAMACGTPLPIEADELKNELEICASGTDADKRREGEESNRGLSFNPEEIGQIRTDAWEERFGKFRQ